MIRFSAAIVIVAALSAVAHPADEALDRWDTARARTLLPPFGLARSADLERWALVFFLEGEYEKALLLAKQSALPKALLGPAKAAATYVKNASKVQSQTRKIEVYFEPGIDELAVPYVLEAAEAAFDDLQKRLGQAPSRRIRIEIIQDFKGFAALVGLKEEVVRTSGTAAMCRYGKIVLVSPSVFPFGYPYADAVAHELVHFFLISIGGQALPVWLQEGLAKYLETAWRTQEPGQIGYLGRTLLAKAMLEGRLIRLESLTAPLITLGNPADIAVAYAELATFMDFLVHRYGNGIIKNLIEKHLAQTGRDPVYEATGSTLAELQNAWPDFIASRLPTQQASEAAVIFLEEPEDAIFASLPPEAMALLRIGDLLSREGHLDQALAYYRQAHGITKHPLVVARLAATLNEIGRPEAALAELNTSNMTDDAFPPVARERGRALLALQRFSEAQSALLFFVRSNPYDSPAHEWLARVFEALGQPMLAERERRLGRFWR